MKVSIIAPFVVVFVLGVIAGIAVTHSLPAVSGDPRESPATPAALSARFDQMEARLGELTAALNQGDNQMKGMGQPDDARQLPAHGSNGREKRANDPIPESAPHSGKAEEIKGRVFNSLQDPATNFTTLLQSKEMQSLSKEQRDDVMREVAARLDSGQLSKEQFLPGYKPTTGVK